MSLISSLEILRSLVSIHFASSANFTLPSECHQHDSVKLLTWRILGELLNTLNKVPYVGTFDRGEVCFISCSMLPISFDNVNHKPHVNWQLKSSSLGSCPHGRI